MSDKEYAVEMRHVSKVYKLKKSGKGCQTGKRFYAVRDISFKVKKGEVVGVLGTNGSGKSTISLLLAEISECDEGEVIVNGEQALISIHAGLNAQLTGEENINLKGALLGLSKKQIDDIKKKVKRFSEVGDFLYQPVKKYSSGMKSRLGFSISLALRPEIFIVDEALSVGDKGFAKKCMKRMTKLRDQENRTIFFISHSLPQMKNFCNKGLWIENGRFMEYGDIDEVCEHYSDYVDNFNELDEEEKEMERARRFQERVITEEKKSFFRK